GIGGQGFHVPALPFGKDGVERQGGLARSGQAGEDDQPVSGQFEVHIAKVVLAGAATQQSLTHAPYGRTLSGISTTVRRGVVASIRSPVPVSARRGAPAGYG